VGAREEDIAYERGAIKRCEKVGVQAKRVLLPGDCTENALVEILLDLNADSKMHGVCCFARCPSTWMMIRLETL
jgi:methylenetetrahydrofolate dehydrogenase (NADP+)/methenyltetrahydrofolate cyclohydrolase